MKPYLDVTDNHLDEPMAMQVAKYLKAHIREETLLGASAGVALNKPFAKITCGWRKRDGITAIALGRVEAVLWQLPVGALWGVERVTASKYRYTGRASAQAARC